MYIRSALHLRNITRVCDFYTKRNLWALAAIWKYVEQSHNSLNFAFTAIVPLASKLYRYRTSGGGGPSLNLYPPSLSRENSLSPLMAGKLKDISQTIKTSIESYCVTGSATHLFLPEDCIDYIFTDPPFGSNIFYADCSILWEAWLQDFTDVTQEAVWNKSLKPKQGGKTLDDYAKIMNAAFSEMHRVLKPGRWASLVFSNSDDKVWRAIRDGAKAAGFELANTSVLDKKQRSFKQLKGEAGEENVVGTDIIMNLHKKARVSVQVADVPDLDAIALSIIRSHLEELPKRIKADPRTYSNSQRATDALYTVVIQELMSRHLSNSGVTMPYIDSLCASAFKKIEGRWFLLSEEILSDFLLTEIQDEPSAIVWLRSHLERRAMTFAELVPDWRQATLTAGDVLEKSLMQLLEENFWHEAETNRFRIPTEAERAKMDDERTLRLKRRLRQVMEGNAEPAPTDQELFELMLFAYQDMSDAGAVVALYGRMNTSNLSESDKKKVTRIYKVSLVESQPNETRESRDDQLQLF